MDLGWLKLVREDPSAYEREVFMATPVMTGAAVARLLRPRLAAEIVEVFVVVMLDGCHHLIGLAEIARGGLHGCGLNAADVFRIPCARGATAIVLAHNHPSGSPKPSEEDIDMTGRLMCAGSVLRIPVVDHVILAGTEKWSSMLELDLLPPIG